MNENYIMLNGKRVDLTEEQLEKLGIKVEKKDCFSRTEHGEEYYCINSVGIISREIDTKSFPDSVRHAVANYCTDKSIMEQRALHETLDRLLWRFSMQNDGDKIHWDCDTPIYYIYYNEAEEEFKVEYYKYMHVLSCFFHTREIAQRAIDEIVLPFMKEHPEFVW